MRRTYATCPTCQHPLLHGAKGVTFLGTPWSKDNERGVRVLTRPGMKPVAIRYASKKAKATETSLTWQAVAQVGRPLLTGPVAVSAAFLVPEVGTARQPDLLNLPKTLMDAMNGVLWRDDRQIREAHLYLDRDAAEPRTELEVAPCS